jgi:hypothetical protein
MVARDRRADGPTASKMAPRCPRVQTANALTEPAKGRGQARGYELIGRIVVTFGRLDARVVSAILRDNGPRSPFPVGPIPGDFAGRWARWVALGRKWCSPNSQVPLDALNDDVLRLSRIRNDFAHNVIWVSGQYDGACAVGTHRLPPTNWADRFKNWATNFAKAPPTQRPAPPQAGSITTTFSEPELVSLLAQAEQAHEQVIQINEAVAARRHF